MIQIYHKNYNLSTVLRKLFQKVTGLFRRSPSLLEEAPSGRDKICLNGRDNAGCWRCRGRCVHAPDRKNRGQSAAGTPCLMPGLRKRENKKRHQSGDAAVLFCMAGAAGRHEGRLSAVSGQAAGTAYSGLKNRLHFALAFGIISSIRLPWRTRRIFPVSSLCQCRERLNGSKSLGFRSREYQILLRSPDSMVLERCFVWERRSLWIRKYLVC